MSRDPTSYVTCVSLKIQDGGQLACFCRNISRIKLDMEKNWFLCANAFLDIDLMRFSAWAFYKRAVMSEPHLQIYVLGSFSS